jgi:uncharacterized membrane protein YdfJ with MMPL/SSD domain
VSGRRYSLANSEAGQLVMEIAKQPRNTTRESGESGWQRAYFEVMVESDRNKALLGIERARYAIQERIEELDHVAAKNPRELQDMVYASTYLGILLMQMGTEAGSLLWD